MDPPRSPKILSRKIKLVAKATELRSDLITISLQGQRKKKTKNKREGRGINERRETRVVLW